MFFGCKCVFVYVFISEDVEYECVDEVKYMMYYCKFCG